MPSTARRAVSYAVIAAALIAPFEGLATRAYKDTLANGLPTVCYGMTIYDRPVSIGDEYTPEECMAFLVADIPKYRGKIEHCIKVPLSNHQWAAAVSLSYNIGAGAFCRSTFARRLNAHDPKACDSILAFDRAGGKVIRGLQRRREAERKVCYEKD